MMRKTVFRKKPRRKGVPRLLPAPVHLIAAAVVVVAVVVQAVWGWLVMRLLAKVKEGVIVGAMWEAMEGGEGEYPMRRKLKCRLLLIMR